MALAVKVQVQSVSISATSNTVTTQVGLATDDASGLLSFSLSMTQQGTITPRYAIGATTTLSLP